MRSHKSSLELIVKVYTSQAGLYETWRSYKAASSIASSSVQIAASPNRKSLAPLGMLERQDPLKLSCRHKSIIKTKSLKSRATAARPTTTTATAAAATTQTSSNNTTSSNNAKKM
eukprot:4532296-Amphidinium_carterae.1